MENRENWLITVKSCVLTKSIVVRRRGLLIDNNVFFNESLINFPAQPSRNETGVEFNYFNGTTEEAGFLLWITQINKTTERPFNQSTAFPISERHVLTSSQVVMTGTRHWSLDGLHFKDWEYYANDNKKNW